MVPTTSARAVPDPDVLHTALKDGAAVLLNLRTATYYSLNETGSHIWQLMSRGLTLGEISEKLEAEYDVTPDRARQSVSDLASQFAAEKLVHLSSDQGSQSQHTSILP